MDLEKYIITQVEQGESIDLSDWGLKKIPEILFRFPVRFIDLSYNSITSIPSEIKNLGYLIYLDLSHNKIDDITEEVFNLSRLEYLNLSNNNIAFLPDKFNKLSSLMDLNISFNNLEIVPQSIISLNLDEFDVSNNPFLDKFPSYIDKTSPKQVLECFNNFQLANEIIDKVEKEESPDLDLSNLSLKVIPDKVFSLTHLRSIILGDEDVRWSEDKLLRNDIDEIPAEIGNLINLEYIDIRYNNLKSLPEEICELKELQYLYIQNNEIESLPQKIGNLEKLLVLLAQENKLVNIPSSIGLLKNLKELNLYRNEVSILPRDFSKLKKLRDFSIDENPLTSPPIEIVEQGLKAINRWFELSLEDEMRYLRETKLIFIGNGEVGKTTIANNLIDPEYGIKKEERTPGLDILKWNTKIKDLDFKFNIWDFGGQGKYRQVQQFFCSRNAIYLYVTTPTDINSPISDNNKYEGINYWSNLVTLFGHDSVRNINSPIIHVTNQIDLNPEFINRITFEDKIQYKASIGSENIKLCINTSCKTGEGLDKLKKAIGIMLPKVGFDVFSQAYHKDWISVKKRLEKINKPYISYKKYLKICHKANLNNEDAEILLGVLWRVGIVLYFPTILSMKNRIILKPKWIRKAMYDAMDYTEANGKNGAFKEEDFTEIWPTSTIEDQLKYIDLMIDFGVLFKAENSRTYYIPTLFSSDKPTYSWREDNCVVFTLTFTKQIPAGIISTIIVKFHNLIFNKNTYWRNGVILKKEDTFCEVSENWLDKRIDIKIFGGKHITELFILIQNLINNIIYKLKKERMRFIPFKTAMKINDEEVNFKKIFNDLNKSFIQHKISDINYLANLIEEKFKPNISFEELLINEIQIFLAYPPSFIKNFEGNSLKEENFRDEFLRYFISKNFEATAESNYKKGRTDLLVNFGNEKKIVEFKIWNRNDYKHIINQLNSYLTDFEDTGYIVMVNNNKKPIEEKYFSNVISSGTGFIRGSKTLLKKNNFKYWYTEHKTNTDVKKVFHFILNCY